ncbi:type III-B CRISPR module-associated protein Cmr5 [Ectothiorhodospira lacustris]|uniref:type III-B CRISPR module-associated protein Cmr5 n=1 Tax=Ectothiorhodospira TaxID=1051 RepID=UPI001EE83248|nr:type III-B CRISPR module-associated protein Cmr5 [Ectothiorhodospira lacustris]MCG5502079.1 type III-B CRISPR module-associated protein Cmr5 [Ectothiorhodospira lacustris]
METIDHKRATDAWQAAQDYTKDHVNAAKSLPALIINSGLMQVLAFCHDKDKESEDVARRLRRWLAGRFDWIRSDEFEPFMESLMNATPAQFRDVNREAMAWLKWLRQVAPARQKGGV